VTNKKNGKTKMDKRNKMSKKNRTTKEKTILNKTQNKIERKQR